MTTHENCSTILTCFENYFILSRDPLYRGSVTSEKQKIMSDNRKTEYNGFMSPATKRKVRTILTTWIKAVKFGQNVKSASTGSRKRKLTFVTLTLSQSQMHTDNEIKRKMLNRFLIKAQRNFDVKYYFWRAEKQKNGNLHFHVILDSYIDKTVIQTEWNLIQADFGYLDNYFTKHRHYKAPSTDVGAIANMNNAVEYVLKYVCKNPDNLDNKKLKVSGRIWSCSKELKELKPYSIAEDKPLISRLFHEADKGNIEALEADFFTIFRCNTSDFLQKHFKRVLYQHNFYYEQIYRGLYINPKTKIIISDPKPKDKVINIPTPIQLSLGLKFDPVFAAKTSHFDN